MRPLVERFVFGRGDDWGFLKVEVQAFLMAPTKPLNSPSLILSSHL